MILDDSKSDAVQDDTNLGERPTSARGPTWL